VEGVKAHEEFGLMKAYRPRNAAYPLHIAAPRMQRSIERKILFLCVTLIFIGCDDKETQIQEAQSSAMRRREQIAKELGASDVPSWAGIYSSFDKSIEVAVAPAAGMTIGSGLNDGGDQRWNQGPVTSWSSTRVEVELALPVTQQFLWERGEQVPIGANSWIAVRWSDVQFLVPEHRMVQYCNAINSQRNRSNISGDLRKGFLSRPSAATASLVDGATNAGFAVPAEYQQYLLNTEVVVSAVAVEYFRPADCYVSGDECYETSLIVTVDHEHKLKRRMALYFVKPVGRGEGIIREVDDEYCHVVFIGPKTVTEVTPPIQAGDRLSTYWYPL
jgi:hypothetical protein